MGASKERWVRKGQAKDVQIVGFGVVKGKVRQGSRNAQMDAERTSDRSTLQAQAHFCYINRNVAESQFPLVANERVT